MLAPLLPQGLGGTKIRKKTVYAYAFNIDTYAPTFSEAPFSLDPSWVDQTAPFLADLLQAPNYNGWVYGGVTMGQPGLLAAGGGSFLFDGSSGYVEILGGFPSVISGDNPVSVAVLFKTNSTSQQQFFDAGNSGSNYEAFQIGLTQNGGVGGGPPTNTPGVYFVNWANDIYIPGLNLGDGKNHLLILTLSGKTVNVYIDNTQPQGYIGTGSWSGLTSQPFTLPNTPNILAKPPLIGKARSAIWSTGSAFWNGNLAEPAIFNFALSSSQASAIFSAISSTNASTYPDTILGDSPTGYWRFNEKGGLIAANSA